MPFSKIKSTIPSKRVNHIIYWVRKLTENVICLAVRKDHWAGMYTWSITYFLFLKHNLKARNLQNREELKADLCCHEMELLESYSLP